jgi:repressor LexA
MSTAFEYGRDAPSLVLRRRLREVGLSQLKLAELLDRSQSWVNAYLLGGDPGEAIRRLWAHDPASVYRLLAALRWTPEEFSEATGVDLSWLKEKAAPAPSEPMPHVAIPVFGVVSAGSADSSEAMEREFVYYPLELLKRKGANPETVRAYKVNGDCMVSDEVYRSPKNIAPGDYVLVDIARKPRPGEVVVAWWPEEEKLVVKRYGVEGENILLYPANPAHTTLVLPSEQDVNILGVVIGRLGPI